MPENWRTTARRLAGQLGRAHSAVEALGTVLDQGDEVAVATVEETAHETVDFVAESVKAVQVQQPPLERMTIPDVTRSTLTITGADVATVALDLMVNAMVALTATDDRAETDFLVGASIDAVDAYEVGVRAVDAVARSDDPGVADVARSFRGSRALHSKMTCARPRVLGIKQRVGGSKSWTIVAGHHTTPRTQLW